MSVGKLTRKQELAIASLMTSGTHARAAEATGISEATLQRWLKLPGFAEEYRRRRLALVDDAVKILQAAAGAAVGTLVRKLDAPKDADGIKAAQLILDQAFRGTELLHLAEQVEQLKQQVQEIQDGRRRHPRPPG
jgi:hypothetical protein